MFYRHNKTFWYQVCNFKHFLKAERPPSLLTSICVDPCMARHAQSLNSSLHNMLDRKIWKLFRPRGNGRKRTKCDQFFCPTSDYSDFCNGCFFYHTFTNDVGFVDKAYAEICDHFTVCLHSSFARLKNKHMGVLGTNAGADPGGRPGVPGPPPPSSAKKKKKRGEKGKGKKRKTKGERERET